MENRHFQGQFSIITGFLTENRLVTGSVRVAGDPHRGHHVYEHRGHRRLDAELRDPQRRQVFRRGGVVDRYHSQR